MKLNKETLKQIIKEELESFLSEDDVYDDDPGHRVGNRSPVPELNNNPDMDVDELVAILLSKSQLGHPHPGIGGFDDYDTNMYELRQFIKYNKGPAVEKIVAALEDPRIKTQRNKG
tara:strand:+ start:85 stop:432 length:348 start_codon:yes stop_codon:yes gene_type:complete